MKIGDRCFVHGYVDEIRNDVVIIRNSGGYFGTPKSEVIVAYNNVHPNWIFTKNRLPDKNEDVLLYHIRYGVTIWFLSRENQWYISGIDVIQNKNTVVAWMPLPEPLEGYEE